MSKAKSHHSICRWTFNAGKGGFVPSDMRPERVPSDALPLTIAYYGHFAHDVFPADGVSCTGASDGLAIEWSPGKRLWIPTDGPTTGSGKVTARHSLAPLVDMPLVGDVRVGGGAARAATAAAEAGSGLPLNVCLLNEAHSGAHLLRHCRRHGIAVLSLGCMRTPTNFVAPNLTDRTIIRETLVRSTRPVPRAKLDCAGRLLSVARVFVCVSAKDAALAEIFFARAGTARKYFQPTGGLPADTTVRLAGRADDLCCNLQELRLLCAQAGWRVPEVDEADADAPACAASWLRRLHARGLAGTLSATVTLGRQGCLAANWPAGRLSFVEFHPVDSRAFVPTRVGTGDEFLGALTLFGNMPRRGRARRDRAAEAAMKATRFVAGKLGIMRSWYRLDVTRL